MFVLYLNSLGISSSPNQTDLKIPYDDNKFFVYSTYFEDLKTENVDVIFLARFIFFVLQIWYYIRLLNWSLMDQSKVRYVSNIIVS